MSRSGWSGWVLALLTALFIVAVNNRTLFVALFEQLPLASPQGAAYFTLLVTLMSGVLFALFLLAGIGPLLKPLLALLLVVSAVLGYFTNELGVVFDLEMMRNLAEAVTDRNGQEAGELLSWPLATHVVALGILPAALVIVLPLRKMSLRGELRQRALCVIALTTLTAGLALPNYKYLTYFSVEHRGLQFQATPVIALVSMGKYLKRRGAVSSQPLRRLGVDAALLHDTARRRVGVMVVGETARADHFSLGQYGRNTNPLLQAEDDVMYAEIRSCGTSTAYSVPCMFSMRGHDKYSPQMAKQENNVLDILETAGVNVVWIDNNSSCKGVCKRIENVNLRLNMNTASPWYSEGGYYDGVLLEELDRSLASADSDVLIILHALGSHGPAYSRRYPQAFEVFHPSCKRKSPKECSNAEVINAYDNTIVYTDYLLDSVIKRLQARLDKFDSFMLYASDHGESLGEHGVYLHGLPYLLAPRAQTRVPLIVWMSPPVAGAYSVGPEPQPGSLSHDNISHTLLGLFDVSTHVYNRRLDILADGKAKVQESSRMAAKDSARPRI